MQSEQHGSTFILYLNFYLCETFFKYLEVINNFTIITFLKKIVTQKIPHQWLVNNFSLNNNLGSIFKETVACVFLTQNFLYYQIFLTSA